MTTNTTAVDAVQTLADALYCLDQVAIEARDAWRVAKDNSDEATVKEKRKLKVKIHDLKKKAVTELTGQGYGTIKGYYICTAAYGQPHLLAITIRDREFMMPIKREYCAQLPFLGERGLVEKDTSFESKIAIGQAFTLINTYLNPNYEQEISKFKKKAKKPFKKGFKGAAKGAPKKPHNKTPQMKASA